MGANENTPALWKKGVKPELLFWNDFLERRGGRWPEDFRDRMDPEFAFQDFLIRRLDVAVGSTLTVLDVGAGPLTYLGKIWPGRTVEIIAVDPLAADYDLLLARHGLTPPLRTQVGFAEQLIPQFGFDRFDCVHARNCIDHSYDPVMAIEQMVAVAKPGGLIFMHHAVNEAETQHYQGFHQWNLATADGQLLVNSRDTSINVTERLKGVAEVRNELDDTNTWLTTHMYKLP